MRFTSSLVLLQGIWLCAARPVDLQPATLTTITDEILTSQDVVSGIEEWLRHKSSRKCKDTDNGLRGGKSEQGIDKPQTPLDRGKFCESGKLHHKVNGTVSNGTIGDGKSNGEPDAKSKVDSKINSSESNPISNSTNGHKKPLEWHNKRCFGTYQFGKHKDIYPISQQNYAGFACPETESKMIKKDDNSTFISYQRWIYGAPYLYNVYWKDLCELENGKTEQDVTDPLEEGWEPGARVCQESLTKAYRGCDNEGAGGSLQAGCLVYEFQARDKDKKAVPWPWMGGGISD
ncbi:hypothetical protein J7337_009247 [Fusarium musae]|uniref:Uncharacterized protein n=1 Tax=Fusarium musae TaxID=1042133 RepID=A0A9P8IM21_9HYPO|nr:hypothetical protein J7337_009247 [Fusarium musae]KAG9498442.1 hypothetical protein J7337_009247 [Fusarium musae]